MDPFTIVTGSAGLLSTSITVCHGLISYCRSYRSREEDLSVLQQNAERLKLELQLLENRCQTATSTDQDFRNGINECITSCGKCLDELGQLSDKYSPPSTGSGVWSRRQVLSRRLLYPFQKDKFESFRQQIHGLHFVLIGYMEVLNYDLNTAMRDESRAHAKDLASLVFDGTEGIKGHIDTALPEFAEKLEAELSKTGEALMLRLESIEGTLEDLINNSLDKPLQPASQTELHAGPLELTTNSTVAGYTMDSFSSQTTCVASRAAELEQLVSLTPVPGSCNCFKSSGLQAQRKPCLHTQWKRTRRTVSGELSVFSYLVQIRVAIEYSQKTFLHDLQIQPQFTIRATVPSDSPAFALVGDMVRNMINDSYSSQEELRRQVQICLRDLQGLFLKGQAWPTDVDTHSENLMDVACKLRIQLFQPNVMQIHSDFLEGLAHLSVPPGCGPWQIRYSLRLFKLQDTFGFHDPNFVVRVQILMKTLARLGADLWDTDPRMAMINPGPRILKVLGQDMLGQHHSIGYPALSYALLQRSEAKIRAILSGKCEEDLVHLLKERGPWDQTPLHVSTYWPRGMQLIFELAGKAIEYVIGMEDSAGKTALDYAVGLGEIDSVKQLVTHGHAEIDLESRRRHALFRLQQPKRSQEALFFMAHILANRRRQLYDFAVQTLEPYDQLKPRMGSSYVDPILQKNAWGVVQQLRATGIDIPRIFYDILPGSIYHFLYEPSLDLLEALYQAGFSHTNVIYCGLCPLMTTLHHSMPSREFVRLQTGNLEDIIAPLEIIIWFRHHGADLYRPIPQSAIHGSPGHHDETHQFRLIHQLSDRLGHFAGRSLAKDDNFKQRFAPTLREIILSPDVDPCTCFCSLNGCTAISLLARKSHDEHNEREVEAFHVVQDLDPGADATFRVVSDLLRLLTFEKLGMSHTCCAFVHRYRPDQDSVQRIPTDQFRCLELMDPEEIAEIREEDEDNSLLLEELVLDFEEQYRSFGKSLWDFWHDYCLPRMAELDTEGEHLSPEEEDAIRDIGVVLHDTR